MLKRLSIILALTAAAMMPAQAEHLVILHTNDTHSQIDPHADGMGGVARRKVLIDSVRSAAENVILVDAGDIVQGTLFFNIYKGEVEEGLMNLLGYDMRILGNHEFDNGISALADLLKGANAELLAANYQMRDTPLDGLFQPYSLREIGGKRIAFIPVNLDPDGMILARSYPGMVYLDAIETANNLAWYLKNVMQADYVVALTHVGYKEPLPPCDVDLVRSSKDIDVVIGGHSHTTIDPSDPSSPAWLLKNAEGRDVVVAQTGRYGRYLGEITIDLDSLDKVPAYRLIPVDSRLDSRTDPEIEAYIAPYRAKVDSLNNNVIARTARVLDRDKSALLNFGSDFVAHRGRQLADNVDFALLNKGSLRNTLPAGDISEGQIITLIPFFNLITVIDIAGRDLLDAFDVMAVAGGNGVSSEVEAVYDPQTKRCLEVRLNGEPLDPDRIYRIATNDYLALGGDYMSPLKKHTLVAESPNYLFEDLIIYLRDGDGRGRVIDPSDTVRMHPVK